MSRDIPHILTLMKCEPDTSPVEVPAGHNERVMAVKRQFAREAAARRSEQEHTRPLTQGQRYVLRELRLLRGETDDAERQTRIDILADIYRQPISRAVRDRLNALRRDSVTGGELLAILEEIEQYHELRDALTHRSTETDEGDTLPIIVCSEGLT